MAKNQQTRTVLWKDCYAYLVETDLENCRVGMRSTLEAMSRTAKQKWEIGPDSHRVKRQMNRYNIKLAGLLSLLAFDHWSPIKGDILSCSLLYCITNIVPGPENVLKIFISIHSYIVIFG